MLNWVGAMPSSRPVLGEAIGHWHDYGKSPRDGRKVGHATFCGDESGLAASLRRVAGAIDRESQIRPVIAALKA
jgi:5-(carboxyamino)imidazole ribonucleotide synthase